MIIENEGIIDKPIGLDDDLMKIFGGNTITKVYDTLGADENMPVEAKILSRTVESAQKKVESKNYSIRKNGKHPLITLTKK